MTTDSPTPRDLGALLDRAVRQYRAAADPAVRSAWLAVIRKLVAP